MRLAALFLAFGCLLLAGCATTTSGGPRQAAATEQVEPLKPSPFIVLGHVIAVDANTGNTIIDLAPGTGAPLRFDGAILFARTAALQLTAKLQASPYLDGHFLGARLLAGRPGIGDEVIIPAPAPPPESAPLSPLPTVQPPRNAQRS